MLKSNPKLLKSYTRKESIVYFHNSASNNVSMNNRREKSQYEMDFTRSTIVSLDKKDARNRVLTFYRRCLKSVPQIQSEYMLEYKHDYIAKRIREEFEKHSNVDELEVVDMLRWKGEHDLDEYLKQWKTKSHVLKFLAPKKKATSNDFLQRFLSSYQIEEK